MRPHLLCAILVLALCSIFERAAFSQAKSPSSLKFSQQNELLQIAGEQGTVPIIVQLSTDNWASKSARRLALAKTQQSILDELSGAGQVKQFKHIPFLALEASEDDLNRILGNPHVAYVQKDEIYKPLLAETTVSTGAEMAWSYGGSGIGQNIAVIDTGVDRDHEFLAGKVVNEACFSKNYASTNSDFRSISLCPEEAGEGFEEYAAINCDPSISGCDHGTRVAGIVAGRSESMSGVARDAGVVAVQVFSRFEDYCGTETCVRSWTSDQVAALEYVYEVHDSLNIAAVNMSLGGGHYTSEEDCNELNPAMRAIIGMLHEEGVAVIAASGNSGLSDGIVAPACISNAISVGSTSKYDAVSSFSSSADFLDLLAPGQGIVTSTPGGGYSAGTGTSFSAPHAAGAWAILRSVNPDATIDELLIALQATGVSITDDRNAVVTPRIQIDAALQMTMLPVELVSFNGVAVNDGMVDLVWETASETNNAGFEVQHSVDRDFADLDFIPGGGTRGEPASYSYRARNLAPGRHFFRLKQIDFDGFVTYSPEVEVFIELGSSHHLGAAYPNPFNPSTQFTLTLAREQRVRIDVYDLLGKHIATLVDDVLEAGRIHPYTLDGSQLASGIYLIRATGESFRSTRSVTLLK